MSIGNPSRFQGCCRCLATYILFIANIVFLFACITFIGLSLIFLVLQTGLQNMVPLHVSFNLFAVPVITAGVVVYIVSVLGIYSTWKQWRCLLILYILCLVFLIVEKVTMVVEISKDADRVEKEASKWVHNYFEVSSKRYTFHMLETTMQCCGTDSAKAYHDHGLDIPRSCCDKPVLVSSGEGCVEENAFEGCGPVISTLMKQLVDAADATLFYAIAIEVLALIASVYLLLVPRTVPPQLAYTIVPRNNPDTTHHVEMDEMQLVTSQPERQIVYEPCEIAV